MFKTKQLKNIALSMLAISLTACAVSPPPQKTSLELQAMQSKTYESSKDIVFASVISVFQDLGYTVSSADKDTGFITAKSPTTGGFKLFVGTAQVYTNATAFVEEIKNNTKVRLNFVEVEKTSSGYGQQRGHDTPIHDLVVYQNAHSKIAEAVFIRTETN